MCEHLMVLETHMLLRAGGILGERLLRPWWIPGEKVPEACGLMGSL